MKTRAVNPKEKEGSIIIGDVVEREGMRMLLETGGFEGQSVRCYS